MRAASPWSSQRHWQWTLAIAGVVGIAAPIAAVVESTSTPAYDALLDEPGVGCSPTTPGRPALLQRLVLAKAETQPFVPQPMRAAAGAVPLFDDLGSLSFPAGTKDAQAQAYFDQGLRLAFGFNHAEAQRAFQTAYRIDDDFALAYWGEAFVLGPNINAPMEADAVAPALAALAKAVERAERAPAKDRELIKALQSRYSSEADADRTALDAAFADAMQAVSAAYPDDDSVLALYAESIMDTQPWDYWEAAGTQPKARAGAMLKALETILARNPRHPGAIHLYIHAVEASAQPERALPHARRLEALMPGAGHIVHMPAHIYYRLGLYKESMQSNKRAMAVDERYFETSPSDPMYRFAYYPHNIHFVLVSAQMGGDAGTALVAAAKLDATLSDDVVAEFAALEPVKAAPYLAHAMFSAPETVLALKTPPAQQVLVSALAHYARAVGFAADKQFDAAQGEIDAIRAIVDSGNFKPYEYWAIPSREIVQTAALVAEGRLADAKGDLAAAAKAYQAAIVIEDALAYMEPPFWYYPIRQSLGSVYLRQGQLEAAEDELRRSLLRVRSNGWALAGLAEVYQRKGDRSAAKATRKAFEKAWLGTGKPDLARL